MSTDLILSAKSRRLVAVFPVNSPGALNSSRPSFFGMVQRNLFALDLSIGGFLS